MATTKYTQIFNSTQIKHVNIFGTELTKYSDCLIFLKSSFFFYKINISHKFEIFEKRKSFVFNCPSIFFSDSQENRANFLKELIACRDRLKSNDFLFEHD